MKIAVIGGGASGMVSAWLLGKNHQVHLYEKAPVLGGNIRTLNRNVSTSTTPKGVYTENGVCFFPVTLYPNFKKLMDILNIKLNSCQPPFAFYQNRTTLINVNNCPPLRAELGQFLRDTSRLKKADFSGRTVDSFLGSYSKLTQQYLKNILELTYSMNCRHIGNLPAELGIPLLRGSLIDRNIYFIPDGVYAYFEKMLASFSGQVFLNTSIQKVNRNEQGIELIFNNGEQQRYDKVIFATTPDQVLPLLADPNAAELRRFRNWKANRITTYAHTDSSIYGLNDAGPYSFVDFFHEEQGGKTGYYTCLNQPYNIKGKRPYYISYNFEKDIAQKKTLHIANHITPFYNLEAIKYLNEIRETNGERNTYYAGAWLYDGLHEGAIESAMMVSRLLGASI